MNATGFLGKFPRIVSEIKTGGQRNVHFNITFHFLYMIELIKEVFKIKLVPLRKRRVRKTP